MDTNTLPDYPPFQLPIVKVPYVRWNPDWVGEYVDGKCVNLEAAHLPKEMLEAEVLTVNLNTSSMRVRFLEKQFSPVRGKAETITTDTHIAYFLNAFDIVGKGI